MVASRIGMVVSVVLFAACSSDTLGPADLTKVPASLDIVDGADQTDSIGATLARPITVELATQEASARPIAGVIVNFVVVEAGCGRAFAGSAMTDDRGRASERWELGTKAGSCTMEARAVDPDGTPRVLSSVKATVRPGIPTRVGNVGEGGAWVGDQLDAAAIVKPIDRAGNVVTEVAASFASLPAGVTVVGGSRLSANREVKAVIDVTLGSVLARGVSMSWYQRLDNRKWRASFGCRGSEGVDSIIGDVTLSDLKYDGSPRSSIFITTTAVGEIRKYSGASIATTPWPKTQILQRAGEVTLSIETAPQTGDQSFRASSSDAAPSRYGGTLLCHASFIGAKFGTPPLRPNVFEAVK